MDQTDIHTGQHVGNYITVRRLGSGGMGTVLLAEHPEIKKKVAIKLLHKRVAADSNAADRFLAEARAAAAIQHPNVISIFDFGRLENRRPYYVMELLPGRPLNEVIKERGQLAPAEVWPYLSQICGGLQAAHDCGVVHRDLKPSNIHVMGEDPVGLKILDFGIAKLLQIDENVSTTATGMVFGTPLVIAPEQAAGQPSRISPRTDIYSLGVVLYWMLAGRPPFVSNAPGYLLAMHLNETPPPLREVAPHVPQNVAAVVEQCLAKEPEQRPESASELARLFSNAISGTGQALVGATGPSLPGSDEPVAITGFGELSARIQPAGARRIRLLLVVLALAIAAVVVGAALRTGDAGSAAHEPRSAAVVSAPAGEAAKPDKGPAVKTPGELAVKALDAASGAALAADRASAPAPTTKPVRAPAKTRRAKTGRRPKTIRGRNGSKGKPRPADDDDRIRSGTLPLPDEL